MFNHVFKWSFSDGKLSQENNVVAWERTSDLGAYRPHTTFCPIAPYGVSQAFSCNKSNTTVVVVLILVP